MNALLCLAISFFASVGGAICGIGGGVIIKPVMDLFQVADVAAISFLSGCTVLSMSSYSVGKSILSGEKAVNLRSGTPLALGAALGGILGKQLFSWIRNFTGDPQFIGGIQSLCLAAVTLVTLIYVLKKQNIRTLSVNSAMLSAFIGCFLGLMSSFLGIGGGPINLVVLGYFFGMSTKIAAANSLYIIFFSQTANLLSTILSSSVPEVELMTLILMICGGIGGGIAGRAVSKRIKDSTVDKLFVVLIMIIILISLYNAWNYF